MAMRYYQYLSAAKVEMLYPQINRSSKSAGGEVGFDIKILKVSRKTDGKKEPSIYEKLTATEDWIYAHEPVGSIEEPRSWIYGRMQISEVAFTGSTSLHKITPGVALYGARVERHTYLLMGGSSCHLSPQHRPTNTEPIFLGGSNLPVIHRAAIDFAFSPRKIAIKAPIRWPISEVVDDLIDRSFCHGLSECEFLAKSLQTLAIDGRVMTVATPLFIAISD